MLAQELHYLLLVGYQYSSRAIIKQTNARQLMPGQPKILEFLLEHNGCTQREIGEGCALDKSTVTSLLYRMEDLGLVRKEACEQDRRVSHIFLKMCIRDRKITSGDDFPMKNLNERIYCYCLLE